MGTSGRTVTVSARDFFFNSHSVQGDVAHLSALIQLWGKEFSDVIVSYHVNLDRSLFVLCCVVCVAVQESWKPCVLTTRPLVYITWLLLPGKQRLRCGLCVGFMSAAQVMELGGAQC